MKHEGAQPADEDWVGFPGGELEGRRPRALCPSCREALKASTRRPFRPSRSSGAARPLCFQCYRAELDRQRALRDAGQLDTASEARFQFQLPFESVDKPRLEMLKAELAEARTAAAQGPARFADKRRQAQLAARHALQTLAAGLASRQPATTDRAMAMAIHAAELQLPESWLPFVISRPRYGA